VAFDVLIHSLSNPNLVTDNVQLVYYGSSRGNRFRTVAALESIAEKFLRILVARLPLGQLQCFEYPMMRNKINLSVHTRHTCCCVFAFSFWLPESERFDAKVVSFQELFIAAGCAVCVCWSSTLAMT
jgi:hypothetical protein